MRSFIWYGGFGTSKTFGLPHVFCLPFIFYFCTFFFLSFLSGWKDYIGFDVVIQVILPSSVSTI